MKYLKFVTLKFATLVCFGMFMCFTMFATNDSPKHRPYYTDKVLKSKKVIQDISGVNQSGGTVWTAFSHSYPEDTKN